jgi:uncharacterized membrane protein YoaK (UPF0700 family)
VDTLRVRVCVLVIVTFTLGSAAGALLFPALHERTLLVPAALTGLCGLGYTLYRRRAPAGA